jgi:DNA-binding NarL/FixJ family response regulator
VHSRGDAIVPIEEGRALASAIADARFLTLESDNHIPLLGEPAFEVATAAITDFVAEHAGAGDPDAALPRLTGRELQLARALAGGLDNLQIAARLGVSEKTVRNAVSALYAKLEVEGRAQAIVRLRRAGLHDQD